MSDQKIASCPSSREIATILGQSYLFFVRNDWREFGPDRCAPSSDKELQDFLDGVFAYSDTQLDKAKAENERLKIERDTLTYQIAEAVPMEHNIEAVEAENDKLKADLDEALEALKESEWGSGNGRDPILDCPSCGSPKCYGHLPKCDLAAILAKHKGE